MPYLRSAMGGALLAAAITAPAGAETAIFDFYIAGIKAGEARLDLSETKGAYQAKSRIDAAGLVGAQRRKDRVGAGRIGLAHRIDQRGAQRVPPVAALNIAMPDLAAA